MLFKHFDLHFCRYLSLHCTQNGFKNIKSINQRIVFCGKAHPDPLLGFQNTQSSFMQGSKTLNVNEQLKTHTSFRKENPIYILVGNMLG